jgi:hypothetical protein
MLALVVILLLLLGWALIAGRLARFSVTAPLALLVAGVALTAGADPVFVFDIEFEAAERIVEVIAAILLFTDAAEVPGGVLGREPHLTLRLLLIALWSSTRRAASTTASSRPSSCSASRPPPRRAARHRPTPRSTPFPPSAWPFSSARSSAR